MSLSLLAILLGVGFGAPQVYGLWRPAKAGALARKFPRSEPCGYALMLLGTAWFLWNLVDEKISDFEAWKPYMILGFAGVGIGACFFVRDFLAVRGLSIVLLLLAKAMVDTARWPDPDTGWRLVVVTWAYLLVAAGMWWTVAPWRLRDWIEWATKTEPRIRLFSGLRLAFCLFVVGLGLTVFRS